MTLKSTSEKVRKKPGPKPGTVIRAHAPTPEVAKLIGQSVYLICNGKTMNEVAQQLGVHPAQVADWRCRWRDIWDSLLDKTASMVMESVQAMAGTEAILDDPDRFICHARLADEYATKMGKNLFETPSEEMTLSKFFEDWYYPRCLFDGKQSTVNLYRQVLRHWRLLMGDPAVKAITTETMARYRDARLKMHGLKRHLRMSPNTVRTELRLIQTLLDKLGPAGRRNRDAVEVLDKSPWCRPPREECKIPTTVAIGRVSDCIKATVAMEVPRLRGVKAPAWWRALLIVAWNTGLRRGSLLAMRMSDIDWGGRRLVLPSERMKSRRPLIVYLNDGAFEALKSIRTDRELVFEWPHCIRYFHTSFSKLERAAGITPKDHFGLHIVRKTLATMLAEANPMAAQFALGHTTGRVTAEHYVDGGPMVARALETLNQPEGIYGVA